MAIKLEFDGTNEGCRTKPFIGTEFFYYSTNQPFENIDFDKLIEDLKLWDAKIPGCEEVKFTEAHHIGDETIFAIKRHYKDYIRKSGPEKDLIIERINTEFSLFLDQRYEELKMKKRTK